MYVFFTNKQCSMLEQLKIGSAIETVSEIKNGSWYSKDQSTRWNIAP